MTGGTYRVAGHCFRVTCRQAQDAEELLPSFAPFTHSGDEEPLFHVIVDDDFDIAQTGHEIGQFDCGGCNHGVYVTSQQEYQFFVSDLHGELCCKMQASPDFRLVHVRLSAPASWRQRNHGLNNAMMLTYAFATAPYGTLLLHASVIRWGGKGYLMTAPSGTGKSTHTRLWYDHIPGCDLMNDDNPVVRVTDGEAIIYGSPWSGKTHCYRNIQAPIGAMVRIKQAPQNSIRRMSPLESFATLLPAVSSMKWDKRIYSATCDNISALIGLCKVWEMSCLPNAEAAIMCHGTVTK